MLFIVIQQTIQCNIKIIGRQARNFAPHKISQNLKSKISDTSASPLLCEMIKGRNFL